MGKARTLKPLGAVSLHDPHPHVRLKFALDSFPAAWEIMIRGVGAMGDVTFRWA